MIDGPDPATMTTTPVPSTTTTTAGQDENKHVDMALYSRVPRPMSRPHPLPNEIYIRSGPQPLAPLSKRIKQLLFAGNVDSVHIHAAGKQITTAVKLAVDFVNAYTPWFTTLTYTSTEVVIDDYVPKVDFNTEVIVDDYQRYYNDQDDNTHTATTTHPTSTAMTNLDPLVTATKRKEMEPDLGKKKGMGNNDNGAGDDDDDTTTHPNKRSKPNTTTTQPPQSTSLTTTTTTTTSPRLDGEELVQLGDSAPRVTRLQPFSRERFVSAIHIIITKTPQGQSHVM